jgi:poly(3-hydroxybutyrate) depolymerase
MKYQLTAIFPWIIFLAGCSKQSRPATAGATTDSVTVTVINGYGSGQYKVGDTVDIWSNAIAPDSVFNEWTGDNNLLNNAGEWHSSFIMPRSNITLTATCNWLAPFTLKYEKIKAVNNLKNVYYYFPASQKGIVYLCHGTGGNAQNLVNNFEWREMINDLVFAGYSIVVTEAEEVTLNTDLDGDGKIHWMLLPADTTTNIDYANIAALTDTFYARGYTQPSIPRYSIGMSNGGIFSSALSFIYHYAAGVSYCAPTGTLVTSTSVTPLQFCMAQYDNAPEVGATGNALAQSNASALTARGICSPLYLQNHSRVYPQRWARWNGISLSLSQAIYGELQSNHLLDSRNYLVLTADSIEARIQATPSKYPVISSLTLMQYTFVSNEMDIMYAAHQFFSDYNKTTIHFLEAPCR